MFLLNRKEDSPKLLGQVHLRHLLFKTCFPVIIAFFLEVRKGRFFPTGALLNSSQPETEPEKELDKKKSSQDAQTSTRSHHKPFPAFF